VGAELTNQGGWRRKKNNNQKDKTKKTAEIQRNYSSFI